MAKYNEPVLIISDSKVELNEIRSQLSAKHTKVYATLEQDKGIEWFTNNSVAVLLLCFKSLQQAEEFYKRLFHSCKRINEIPHQVIVFVARSELGRAYEWCQRHIFHSFIVVRPMLSEYFLRLAVERALERRAIQLSIQRGSSLFGELARHVEDMRKDFQLLMKNRQFHEQQHGAQRDSVDSIDLRLCVLRDGLVGPNTDKNLTLQNATAVQNQLEHLWEEKIIVQMENYHSQMNEALDGWIVNLEKNLKILETIYAEVASSKNVRSTDESAVLDILIIDDDEIQRHMLNTVLASEGYVVRQAANGAEGMNMFQAERPDLILLDYEMPDVDGIEVLTEVRKHHSQENLPVIMITGHSETDVVNSCLMCGANDFLVKPVKIDRLHDRLRHYFPHHGEQT